MPRSYFEDGSDMKYVSLLTPRRCEKRSSVYLDSSLALDGVEQIAVTRNISTMGAMVECENPPAAGSTVILKCAALELEGTVVWALEQRLGLRFVQSLEEGVLKRATGPALRMTAPGNYKGQRFKPDIDCTD